MTAWAAMHTLAAISGLIVIALTLMRGSHSPLRRPLALLAADQFAWNAAAVGGEISHHHAYALLGALTAPFFTPLAFDFVLGFVGKRRALRWLLFSGYGLAAFQVLVAAVHHVFPTVASADEFGLLALLLLLAGVPYALLAFVLVARHWQRTGSPIERLRAAVLFVALTVVLICLVTDPLADLGLHVPRLATVGSFFFNALLTHLTLGLKLWETKGTRRLALGQALLMALLFSVASLALFNAFSARQGALLVAFIALTLGLAVTGWLYLARKAAAQAGLERFATLGRFSAQMAHDLKNPLAAAKGAAEFLQEELRRAGLDSMRDFSTLLVEQLSRLQHVIDRYQRLSKLEPQFSQVDINQLVKRVLSLQQFTTQAVVAVETQLANPSPLIQADSDLLGGAIENLVKNALDAMPERGTLTVSTELIGEDDQPHLRLAVKDTGLGFNARAKEQAFELFFTTKATGSGLGLAFVREVARAHGGDASLSSREGKGTTVSLVLPVLQLGSKPP